MILLTIIGIDANGSELFRDTREILTFYPHTDDTSNVDTLRFLYPSLVRLIFDLALPVTFDVIAVK